MVSDPSQATKAYQLLWVKRQPLAGVDGNPLLRIFQPTGRGKVVLAVGVALPSAARQWRLARYPVLQVLS